MSLGLQRRRLSQSHKDFGLVEQFQLKNSKGLVVVFKGIEPEVDETEISKVLSEEGFKIFKVEPKPELKKLSKSETHPICNLRYT